MIRLVLVEDERLVREGLRELLSLRPEFEVAGEAASGPEALAVIRATRPDVILLDVRLPGHSGPEVLELLAAEGLAIPAILLSTFDDGEAMVRGLRAGARGYLRKDVSLDQLAHTIQAVLRGETILRPAITEGSLARLRMISPAFESAALPDPLTPRETQVLRLMAAGLSNREIAGILRNTEGTIKAHASSILSKLGVRDRTRAVLKGLELGYI